MIVEKEWFAGLFCLPVFMTLALALNHHVESVILYLCLLVIGIRICTLGYYYVVTKRALQGGSVRLVCLQWLMIQALIIFLAILCFGSLGSVF